jgi:hypothetical protein
VTQLAICGRRACWAPRPETSRTQHSCGLWRPGPAGPGGCAREQAPARPDTHSFPAPWPFESDGLVSSGERPVRLGSRLGRVVGRFLPLPGCAPAGSCHRARRRQARPVSHQSGGLPGLRPRTPTTGSWPSDNGVSSLWLAPQAPVRRRLTGRPVAQCLTKRSTSKTSLVCSMW